MAAVELTEQVRMSLVHGYLTFFNRRMLTVISFELFVCFSCWIILMTKI